MLFSDSTIIQEKWTARWLILLLLILSATLVASAGEPRQVIRSVQELKSSPAPDTNPALEGSSETPGLTSSEESEPPQEEKPDIDIGFGVKGVDDSKAHDRGPAGFLGSGDKPPGMWDSDAGWEMDPERGRPKINLPLTIGSLLVVLLVAYGALKIYSLYTGVDTAGICRPRGKLLNIREKQMIGPNKQLCIVEMPGKIVLLGITDSEMRVLTEIEPDRIPRLEDQPEMEECPDKVSPSSYFMDVFLRRNRQG